MFRELARKRQALSKERIAQILETEKRGVLSVMGDDGYPYGVPINYWYCRENGRLYFHSGKKGHKVDALREHEKVSFCVYDAGYRRDGEWALNISSIIIFGKMHVVSDPEQAKEIYKKLSLKFTDDVAYIKDEIQKLADATICYELSPEHITGKLVNEA